MTKTEIKAIIAEGCGMMVSGKDFTVEELALILHSTPAMMIVEVTEDMTYPEIKRLAKEGRGHVFLTGDRLKHVTVG